MPCLVNRRLIRLWISQHTPRNSLPFFHFANWAAWISAKIKLSWRQIVRVNDWLFRWENRSVADCPRFEHRNFFRQHTRPSSRQGTPHNERAPASQHACTWRVAWLGAALIVASHVRYYDLREHNSVFKRTIQYFEALIGCGTSSDRDNVICSTQ